MSKTVLITRPEPEASIFAKEIEALGFQTLVEPMLELKPVPYERPEGQAYDGIIITSASALRFFKAGEALQNLPVYVPGLQTQEAAAQAGFCRIICARGAARNIVKLLQEDKKYLHIAGRARALVFGAHVETLIVYEAVQTPDVSDRLRRALEQKKIDMALFFSTRTAENFITLVQTHNLEAHLKSINSLSISADVLKCVRTCQWRQTYIARTPDRQGMIEALKQWNKDMNNVEKTIENAEQVIERFGGIRPMASKTNIPVTTIQGWKKRGTIPAARTAEVIASARAHNIELMDILDSSRPGHAVANENAHSVPSVTQNPAPVRPENLRPEKPNNFVPLETIVENNLLQSVEEKMQDMERRAILKSAILSVLLILIASIALIVIFWPAQKRFENEDARRAALEQEVANAGSQESTAARLQEKFADLKLQAQTKTAAIIAQGQEILGTQTPLNTQALLARFNELKRSISGEEQLENAPAPG